eukprot:3538269-Amphidinium_carterae.1
MSTRSKCWFERGMSAPHPMRLIKVQEIAMAFETHHCTVHDGEARSHLPIVRIDCEVPTFVMPPTP